MPTRAGEGSSDPAHARGRMLAAAAAHQREGRPGEAEQVYRALLAVDGEDFDALLQLGVIKIAQGEPAEAERFVRRCAARGPSSAAAHALLGSAFLALRRYDDAIAQCRQSLALDPRGVEAQVNLGSALQALKRHDEAIACYDHALAVDPDLVAAHFNRGTALQAVQRHDEAIACYERALAVAPDLVEARYGVGIALTALDRGAEALTHFERALAADPDFVEAAVALARTLQSLGRPGEAIPRYEQALEIDPDYAEARAGLGTALQAQGRAGVTAGRYEAAFDCFEKALALAPDAASSHADFGWALAAASRFEEAVIHYRQGVALDPGHADMHANLGAVLLQTGRIDEARRAYERVIALAPGKAAPYLALAELQRMTRGDPLLAAMEQLASAPEALDAEDAMRLHIALGKAYGDIGEPERSLRYLATGNALRRRGVTYDEADTLRVLERVRSVFTPALLYSKAGSGEPSPVPVFILGYPRSGSTLVEQVLASHPNVFGAGERTDLGAAVQRHCRGFPDAVPALASDGLRRLGADYVASLARSAPDAIRITDKMPGNFLYIGLIRLALPQARIIHTCRDPVDTCLSCFATVFGEGNHRYSYDLGELGRHYRAYAALMAHWRRVLPDAAMLEIRYEDVVANFEHEARRIVAFCGLPWDDACLAFHETRRVVRTASAFQVRQPIYRSSVGRARAGGDLLQPLLDALAEAAAAAGAAPSGDTHSTRA